jgi:hypothetical protein
MTVQGRWRIALAAITVGGALMAPCWYAPATAVADAGEPLCPLSMILMCRLLPVAPDLDDDVDLTQPLPQSSVEVTPPLPLPAGVPGAPLTEPNPA